MIHNAFSPNYVPQVDLSDIAKNRQIAERSTRNTQALGITANGHEGREPKRITEDKLPARQLECLQLIRISISQNGYPPSRKELAKIMGTQANNVQGFIEKLAKRGFIEHTPGVARGIKVLEA